MSSADKHPCAPGDHGTRDQRIADRIALAEALTSAAKIADRLANGLPGNEARTASLLRVMARLYSDPEPSPAPDPQFEHDDERGQL